MANKLNKLEEDAQGYTTFSSSPRQTGGFFAPRRLLAAVFAKFFTQKGAKALIASEREKGNLEGDTLINPEAIAKESGPGAPTMTRTLPFIPEVEVNRRRRYQEFEQMDDYPEVAAAFDIYADDSTQKDLRAKRWKVISESLGVIKEIEHLFDRIKLDKQYWDIVRNVVKYGDCFIEVVADINNLQTGIHRIKILNPNYIIRVENEFGYLKNFLQEIPDNNDFDAFNNTNPGDGGIRQKMIELDRNQVVHFRLQTADPRFYPYGRSIASGAIRVYRSLKLMEDAMVVYRLSRAPERRIFYIDVGRLPAQKAEAFMEKIKQKFKKEKFLNQGRVDARYNPLSMDEDFFVPVNGTKGTRIETLPGAQNLGEVDDVKYFRDKLLTYLKIPKDYVFQLDASPDRKTNVSNIDVKFARTIMRVQHSVETGFEAIAKRHLKLKKYPASLINALKVELPDPSDTFTKRKLEIDEQKARVIAAVKATGLVPDEIIYKEYFDYCNEEIDEIKELMRHQQEEEMENMEQQAAMGIGPEGGSPMAQAPPPVGANPIPPPASEEKELKHTLRIMSKKYGATSIQSKAIRRILENKH